MAKEFRFPDVGEGITEGEIVRWLVKEGDPIKADESFAEIETDKAVIEMPSPYGGTVLKLHFKEKDIVKVGDVLITIGEKGESAAAAASPAQAPAQPGVPAAGTQASCGRRRSPRSSAACRSKARRRAGRPAIRDRRNGTERTDHGSRCPGPCVAECRGNRPRASPGTAGH